MVTFGYKGIFLYILKALTIAKQYLKYTILDIKSFSMLFTAV